MHEFLIRAATYDDLPALNDLMDLLHLSHHQAEPEHFKTPEEIQLEKSISGYLDDPECFVYVSEVEGQVVGFITGHFCELVSVVSKPVQMGSIDELFVVQSHRKHGIAEALFRKLEEMFDDYGVKQIFVEVWEFNTSAQQFYQKMDFKHHIHWLRKSLS